VSFKDHSKTYAYYYRSAPHATTFIKLKKYFIYTKIKKDKNTKISLLKLDNKNKMTKTPLP
jgi:hypothetical protein